MNKPINLRAAEARELLDAGRCEVVRVMRPQPDQIIHGNPYWFVGGFRTWEYAVNPLPCPLPAPGAVVACREPFKVDVGPDEDGAYGCTYLSTGTRWQMDYSEVDMGRMKPGVKYKSSSCPPWAIRLHARVESRGAEVRDGKWCWVAWLVREEKSDAI